MSVTSTTPESKPVGRRLGAKRKRRFSPWLLLPIGLVVLVAGLLIWQLTRSTTQSSPTTTATVTKGDLAVSVTGSGTVQAQQSRSMSFEVSGTVTEVLVHVGDKVEAGQPLAHLDTSTLSLTVQQASANLRSAEAKLATAQGKGATEQDLASARASLASAQASYERTRKGTATATDVESARAQLASAQAKLAELKAGPTTQELSAARTTLDKARLNLQSQRENLAVAKAKAESAVTTAANNLRDAQDSYSTIYWENRRQEGSPAGLTQSARDQEAAALRAVQNAEASLAQAQAAAEQAKQDEVTGLAQAQVTLSDAQAQLETLLKGATAAELASAEASVASAQASLDKLLNPATPADLASAQASLDQARISLEQLTSPGSTADLASAEASLAQAQVQLAQAKLDLEHATLSAPFDGVVASVGLAAGDSASVGTIDVVNASRMYIEISLSESDIGGVQRGMPVELTFDAVPDTTISGTIETVAPVATVSQNVVTYPVRVSFAPGSAPIKVGMTASGTIITQQISGAILVPSRAVQTMGPSQMVEVRQVPGTPPVSVRVQTGLSANGQTEILSCVDTGSQCLREGDTLVVTTTTSSSSSTQQRNGLGGGFGGPRGGPFP
ncbi:MAG: HlyD family efflux transporter periplasmic adaptor subunit [Oscillochloris sp.]|nr:HlyD family efflux transporter periplasmic adaptor subunit [Oscillochloris sp.]